MVRKYLAGMYLILTLFSFNCSKWTREETCNSLQNILSEIKSQRGVYPLNKNIDVLLETYREALRENDCVEDTSLNIFFRYR